MYLNFVEPIPHGDDKNLNLFGINKVDENAERERLYQEAKLKYPFDTKTGSCTDLDVLIDNVSLDINAMNERIARGDTNRVGKRYVDGYTRRKTELQQYKNTLQCVKQQEAADKADFFATQNEQLANVQKIAGKKNLTSTYILVGMIALVLTVSGIIIVKKLRKP